MALPLILAGPIVRRVDARSCSVWVALSEEADVSLHLWQGVQFSTGAGQVASGQPPLAKARVRTRRFGVRLHVALVTLDLTASRDPELADGPVEAIGLLPGTFYAYDLLIGESPLLGNATGLREQGLLRDEGSERLAGVEANAPRHLALGFDADRLPGFVAPAASLAALKLAHGSCRRASYDGHDATGWLDDHLAANRNAPEAWPQQLYLTGDQIYADDVGTPLLPMLMRLGAEVMGYTERFPIEQDAAFDLTPANFPPMRRGRIVREHAGMTSVESRDHLLGFSEFAAMYLAVWSARVWKNLGSDAEMLAPIGSTAPAELPKPEQLPAGASPVAAPAVRGTAPATAQYLTNWEEFFLEGHDGWVRYERGGTFAGSWQPPRRKPEGGAWRQLEERHYPLDPNLREQLAAVVKFRAAVPKAARVLANCSTYMIWDDHEVSDDWNGCGRWMARVFSRAAGRAIVGNATAAYAIFQAWGNDPAAFRDGNNAELLDALTPALAGPPGPVHAGAFDARLQELFGFPDARPERRARWHYQVDGPVHRSVVLDGRSLRDPGGYDSFVPAKILGESLDRQLPRGPLSDGHELLVLVSAGPVLNPAMLDNVFRPLLAGVADVASGNSAALSGTNVYSNARKLKHRLTFQSGNALREVESWATDPLHLEKLLARLATYPRTLILSGDVHLSNTMAMDYWRRLAPVLRGEEPFPEPFGPGDPLPPEPEPVAPVASRLVQLTSSGVCNGWEPWQETLFKRHLYFQDLPAGVFVAQLGWHQLHGLDLPAGAYIPPARKARLGKSPALVPVSGWPSGTAVLADKPPDWAWRLQLVSDQRPRSERVDAAEPPPLDGGDLDPADPLPGYAAILQRHAIETMRGPRLMRTMVFTPNIGLVGFEAVAGEGGEPGHAVVHRILSALSPELGRFGFGVVSEHRASLEPTRDAEPQLVAPR